MKPARRKRDLASGVSWRPAVSAVRGAAMEAQRSRVPQMAAALSYRTIFGLIPVILVSLVVLRIFASDKDIEDLVTRSLDYAGLSEIAINQDPAQERWWDETGGVVIDPRTGAETSLNPEELPARITIDPARQTTLDQWISSLVQRVSSIPLSTVGVIGLVTLVYAAISMLVEVERAFNQIYRVPRGRSWVRRITQYWTLLTLGGLFLFATFYVGERFKALIVDVGQSHGVLSQTTLSLNAVGFGVTAFISTVLLLLAYMAVPNTRVRVYPALCGAVAAALLWESGKWGFTQYIHYSANYSRLYGSIGLVPLFLLWVYITWLIVLCGLVVAYRLQHPRRRVEEGREDIEPVLVDPACLLGVLTTLAERFAKGQPATMEDLGDAVGLRPVLARAVIDRLGQAGLVHRVLLPPPDARSPAAEGIALARPAEMIRVADVLDLGRDLSPRPKDPGATRIVDRLREAQRSAAESLTIDSFLRVAGPLPTDHHRATAPPRIAGSTSEEALG